MLVGWGGEALALELSAEQAKQLQTPDAGMLMQAIPAADDVMSNPVAAVLQPAQLEVPGQSPK